MIPGQLSMVGFYQFMLKLNLYDSYIPLIVPSIAAPSTVFLLKQYLESVYPKDLTEATRMDGAERVSYFQSDHGANCRSGIGHDVDFRHGLFVEQLRYAIDLAEHAK